MLDRRKKALDMSIIPVQKTRRVIIENCRH